MLAFILLLIVVWIVLGIIGAVVHGLTWLLIIAAVLFLATLVFGGSRLGTAQAFLASHHAARFRRRGKYERV